MRVSWTGAAFIRATTTPARVFSPVRLVSMRRVPSTTSVAASTSCPALAQDRNRLAGQLLLVDQPHAAQHHAIDRDLVAWIDDDDIADDHVLQRHFHLDTVAFDPRHPAQRIQQVKVGARRAPCRQVADDLARFDQADHQRRREEKAGRGERHDGGRVQEIHVQLLFVADARPRPLECGHGRHDQGAADQQRWQDHPGHAANGHRQGQARQRQALDIADLELGLLRPGRRPLGHNLRPAASSIQMVMRSTISSAGARLGRTRLPATANSGSRVPENPNSLRQSGTGGVPHIPDHAQVAGS